MVSVIIPYNKDRGYLSQAIASVEAQTYRNFELILEFGEVPTSVNLNNALKKAKGEFIKICDEDSMLTPNCLEDLRAGIEGFDFVCANAINFSDAFGEWKENEYAGQWGWKPLQKSYPGGLYEQIDRYSIHGGTVLYRKSALLNIGRDEVWDTSINRAEEYDLHLRLLYYGYKLGYVDKTVFKYRIHPTQKSRTSDKEAKKRIIEQIKSRYDKRTHGNAT